MPTESRPSQTPDAFRPSGLESIVRGFEAAYLRGEGPNIPNALVGLAEEARATALVELVHAELELRLKEGEAARVEDYLDRYPELSGQTTVVLGLIDAEYRQRSRGEPLLSFEEYRVRFPELAALLAPPQQIVRTPHAGCDGAAGTASRSVAFDLRDYELLDRVGRGGMGEVYRGKDPALGRDLAIKVLRPELGDNPSAEVRFQREARITGTLQHPNIVPVHNLGRLPDGRLYFSMKLVQGRTLAEMLTEAKDVGRLSEWLGVFEKVCQAVAFAHSRGDPPRPEASEYHGRGVRRGASHGLGTRQGAVPQRHGRTASM